MTSLDFTNKVYAKEKKNENSVAVIMCIILFLKTQ